MKIVVLAGGISTEREVSLITGKGVCDALRERGHQAVMLDVFFGYKEQGADLSDVFEKDTLLADKVSDINTTDPDVDEVKRLRGGNPDRFLGPNVIEICSMADIVFMALHGADGENGKVQAAFDIFGIKYTGSGYLGSAVAMDKGMSKKLFREGNIPTPEGFCLTEKDRDKVSEEIGYPCIVKPCCGGSSVGVSIAGNSEEYQKALDTAFKYEEEVVVEEFIKGREFSVGVIAGEALPVIEIIPKEGFYDYETKYQPGMATDICPANLSEEQTEIMQKYAVEVYNVLKLETYARADFLLSNEDGNIYCLEANTLPGMTPTSLLPQEAKAVGIDYGQLCEKIISEAMGKYK